MVALAQVVAWAAVCGTPCQLIKLDLPAGTMFDQLMQVSLESGSTWLFRFPEVDPHTRVPAIRGTFTVNQAIERILSVTPYVFEWDPQSRPFFWVSVVPTCGVRMRFNGLFPTPPCVRVAMQ